MNFFCNPQWPGSIPAITEQIPLLEYPTAPIAPAPPLTVPRVRLPPIQSNKSRQHDTDNRESVPEEARVVKPERRNSECSKPREGLTVIELGSDKYHLLSKMGEGSYGAVYLATTHDRTLAVKIIKQLDYLTEQESTVMRYLSSQFPAEMFYPKLLRSGHFRQRYIIAMESFSNYASIQQLATKNSLQFYFRKHAIKQIFNLTYRMHNTGVVHLDLSTHNILFRAYTGSERKHIGLSDVKFIDFGTAYITGNIGTNLGLFSPCSNCTTSTVCSPFTTLLFGKMSDRVAMTDSERTLAYKMLDLWSIFHIACMMLHKNRRLFAMSSELLSHLKVEKIWNNTGDLIEEYHQFNIGLFRLNSKHVQTVRKYLQNGQNFNDYDSHFLMQIFVALLKCNADTFQSFDYDNLIREIIAIQC